MRIQTANGIINLDTELVYKIDKLRQTTSAIIGDDTPDLLSIGHRCQELGYGFYWEPYSVPYFVLPDGETEVDLAVENYVPYLFDTGDAARFKSTDKASNLAGVPQTFCEHFELSGSEACFSDKGDLSDCESFSSVFRNHLGGIRWKLLCCRTAC